MLELELTINIHSFITRRSTNENRKEKAAGVKVEKVIGKRSHK